MQNEGKIKIMISEPVPSSPGIIPEYFSWAQEIAKIVARPGTVIDYVSLRDGYLSDGAYASAYNAIMMVQRAYEAEKKGYDAFITGCAGDPNLKECRALVNIPVVGTTEASVLLSSILGNKFSIIATAPEHKIELEHLINGYGLIDKLASIRYPQGLVMEIEEPQERIAILTAEMAKAINEDNAEALFVAHVPDSIMLKTHKIYEIEGVPIVDSFSASVKLAEMLVDLKRAFGTGVCKKSIYKSMTLGWEKEIPIEIKY